ncbi:MAG: phytoene/squalene synthase family protein [Flavobacteriales bacterium]|nr:phytoene/squalene synthase family protein [Flavobacteriales bacterium]
MKSIFDDVSIKCSVATTKAYSTSFSLGIRFLDKSLRDPIYAIYGFVRFADEIVDTFHDYNKRELFDRFRADTYHAIEHKISLNPILNSFQEVYHQYNLDMDHVNTFLKSMEMDLDETGYDRVGFEEYVLGSAEVVGLMCLQVFVKGDRDEYNRLYPYAKRLGAAFQKINFLRDLHADYKELGRAYFPGLEVESFDEDTKKIIEQEIAEDFHQAYIGIQMLPKEARLGVYVAYVYYQKLFAKIQRLPSTRVLEERIRIPNQRKLTLFLGSYMKHSLNLL